ncbi:hypothetical protein K474DRAFT_1706498 [Panus rudis PR-1116 ss-1]|nr:hypothetical protein K474DRAFT_1706498 [Panus rudis PR-1116 ss-1]
MLRKPTYTGIRIRSAEDAHKVFHAVATGHLQLFTHRLSLPERRMIHTGCVFVWEERDAASEMSGNGLERWTDGRRWSCSKALGDFLFYQEKLPEVNDQQLAEALLADRLVKQTYSVFVNTQSGRRKWHLVCYYTQQTRSRLCAIDEVQLFQSLCRELPRGLYQPARTARPRTQINTDVAEQAFASELSRDFSPLSSSPLLRPSTAVPLPPLSSLEVHCDDEDGRTSPSSTTSSPAGSPLMQPDPAWVLKHHVAVFDRDGTSSNSSGITDSSNRLAPLLYMKASPYQPRQPFDVEVLRSFDTRPWQR